MSKECAFAICSGALNEVDRLSRSPIISVALDRYMQFVSYMYLAVDSGVRDETGVRSVYE